MTDDKNPATTAGSHARRGSFTSNTFNSLFGSRSHSVSGPPSAPHPAPISTPIPPRRMSINTLGLSGSPTQTSSPFFPRDRRASTSSASDDSAIDDDVSTSPFAGRRMSLFSARGGTSPGASGRGPPGPHPVAQASKQPKQRTLSDLALARAASGNGLDWSEQFRSRAESAVQHRPSFGAAPRPTVEHERAKSIGDGAGAGQQRQEVMPVVTATQVKQQQQQQPKRERRKPDEVGERMLRGEFYMD